MTSCGGVPVFREKIDKKDFLDSFDLMLLLDL